MGRAFAGERLRSRSQSKRAPWPGPLRSGVQARHERPHAMSNNVIQLHGCPPERRSGERLIRWLRSQKDHLQKTQGRADGLVLPPPSSQAQSRKARYKSNGDVFFATGTRPSRKSRDLAILAIRSWGPAKSCQGGHNQAGGSGGPACPSGSTTSLSLTLQRLRSTGGASLRKNQ